MDLIDTLIKQKDIKEVIDYIHKSDILIYGIGNALKMAEKRGASREEVERLVELHAVGEAFGCYFNKDSEVVSQNAAIGINFLEAKNIRRQVAVAGGMSKADAVISTQLNNTHGVLVTDEAIGREIISRLSKDTN